MSACLEPGCSGAISADGYCDTCGVKASAGAQPANQSMSGTAAPTAPVGGVASPPPIPAVPGPPPIGSPQTSACTSSGCGGTFSVDGYCDTCGLAASSAGNGSASAAAPAANHGVAVASPAVSRPEVPIGSVCGRNGCTGTISSDSYCDTCGLSASAAGAPVAAGASNVGSSAAASAVVDSMRSLAPPTPPDTSTKLPGAGTATARSRVTTATNRSGSTRTGIGAGLVTVPATVVGDPAAAVMSEEKIRQVLGIVPEEERFCSSCGVPVGRTIDGVEGRVKGFCTSCRSKFDFLTNEPTLVEGERVAGQYEILGPLAHGGMGWVYLGRDRAVSNRWVVLKGLLNEDDVDAVAAAVAERQFLAQIEHGNIVNIYNFVTHRGAGYIVMEMVGGDSLNSKLKDSQKSGNGSLPVTDAIAYILGVLPAFGYLHGLGLVYNDLKPANIMAVGDDVKLIDVGAVMRIGDENAAIFGTQGFQAPEVAELGPSISSDLYTVGRTLAVLIINFMFHDGAYLYSLPTPDEEPLFAEWESLYRFLLRATAFHRDDRFQTAEEMSEQLLGVLREIVSITGGRPRASASSLFESDQLANLLVSGSEGYDATAPDWRVLPAARVHEEDGDAAFLLGLPETDPGRAALAITNALSSGQILNSDEVLLKLAWTLMEVRELQRAQLKIGADTSEASSVLQKVPYNPQQILAQVEQSNPWEWRVGWYRAIHHLQMNLPEAAAEGFSRVWTELPGETAPKMGVAIAAELAGKYERSLSLYERVISSDSSYVSAAFGLARCNWNLSNPDGVVAAYNMVPTSSAAHYDAQLAAAKALVAGGPKGEPTLEELASASETIERLQLDAAQRGELSVEIYERALEGVQSGRMSGGTALLGSDLNDGDLRKALEKTYRTQARLATSPDERIRLVDKANAVRKRTLF